MYNYTQKDVNQNILEAIIDKLHLIILPSQNWKVQIDQERKSIIFSASDDTYNSIKNDRCIILSETNNHTLETSMLMNNIEVQIPYIPKIVSSIEELSIILKAFSIVQFCNCYLRNHRENHCSMFSTAFGDVCSDCLQKPDCKQMCNKEEKQKKSTIDVGITERNERSVDNNKSKLENKFNFAEKCNISVNDVCIFCKQRFECEKLLTHYRSHLPNNSAGHFICTICNKVFDCVLATVNHYNNDHKSVKFIKCSMCKQKYTNVQLLQRHIRNHVGFESFLCADYASRRKLMKHSTLNSELKIYICKICKKKYATARLMHQHQKEHYIKMFKCKYCRTTFDGKELLEDHKIICDKRNHFKFTCNICHRKFSCISQKLCHIKRKHSKNTE